MIIQIKSSYSGGLIYDLDENQELYIGHTPETHAYVQKTADANAVARLYRLNGELHLAPVSHSEVVLLQNRPCTEDSVLENGALLRIKENVLLFQMDGESIVLIMGLVLGDGKTSEGNNVKVMESTPSQTGTMGPPKGLPLPPPEQPGKADKSKTPEDEKPQGNDAVANSGLHEMSETDMLLLSEASTKNLAEIQKNFSQMDISQNGKGKWAAIAACAALVLCAAWGYNRIVLKKVIGLEDELVKQQPAWHGLKQVEKDIGELAKLIDGATVNSLSPEVFSRLDASEKALHDLELSRRKQEEMEKWSARLISPRIKAEWKEKTAGLRPSKDDCKGLERTASGFKASLDARDKQLRDVIKKLEGRLKTIPDTISGLSTGEHESSLTEMQAFIDDARYLLFWYDEKNTMGLPFDIDKAWVDVWEPEKTYSGGDAAENCRKDAMSKAVVLKSMLKNSDQWESWSQRLWKMANLQEDAARRESEELNRLVDGFGGYQAEFRKALSEMEKSIARQKELKRFKAEVEAHYREYVSETFQWKGEETIKNEQAWCEKMAEATGRLADIGETQTDDVKALAEAIRGKSNEAAQKLLPVLSQIQAISDGCAKMDKRLQSIRASMMSQNPMPTEEAVKKMGGELKKMEEGLKRLDDNLKISLRLLEKAAGENANGLRDIYIALANRLKATGEGGVTSKNGQFGKELTSFTTSVNNVIRLMNQVNLYEERFKQVKAVKINSKTELDDKDNEMQTILKVTREKMEQCSKEYPLVKSMMQRVQQLETDWRDTRNAWLGTMTGEDEFEKNLEAMKDLLVRMRGFGKWKNLRVQEAVEKNISEKEVDTEIEEYTKRMKELADKTKAITVEQDRRKTDVLQVFEMLMTTFPKMTVILPGGVSMEIVKIKADKAIIGSREGELGRVKEEPVQHEELELMYKKDFWIGKTEVTQAQYMAVMGDNPSHFIGDDLPVEQVSWKMAMEFCQKLTEYERLAGHLPLGYEYSLPTEIEWEFACRAGKRTALNNGRDLSQEDRCRYLDEIGWYSGNSANASHPCGMKKENSWWLRDMHGNVWEWCRKEDSVYVLRGGSWMRYPANCRSSSCVNDCFDYEKGFRIALVPVQ